MKVIKSRNGMRLVVRDLRKKGLTIGFVPTMGYLHAGHLSLVRQARKENDIVVVSIFVNPAQFAEGEDFGRYPRDLKRDCDLLKGSADFVFAPSVPEIYGHDSKISFEIKDLTACLCGIPRPGHFEGVTLVLAKFINIIGPHRVYLGQKDYQQTVVVKRLVEDLFFDVKVVVCPTVREPDGLAMSSRNKYLSVVERKEAAVLIEALLRAEATLKRGEKNPDKVILVLKKVLDSRKRVKVDYIEIREEGTLKPVKRIGKEPVVVALAAFLGKTRLIDNIIFKP